MNREIKFRAWDHVAKKMAYPHTLMSHNFEYGIEGTNAMASFPFDKVLYDSDGIKYINVGKDIGDSPRFSLMQYTGLKDKNGAEIYEGDIMESATRSGKRIVTWDQGTCSFDLVSADGGSSEHLFDSTGENDYGHNIWEVEGNLFQNPELLK